MHNQLVHSRRALVLAAVSLLAIVGCSSDADTVQTDVTVTSILTTLSTQPAVPPSATEGAPTDWTIRVTVAAQRDDGEPAPFELRATAPAVMQSLDELVTMTLLATAPQPVVISGGPDMLSGRLQGPGRLDVAGPVCVMASAVVPPRRPCSADPAVLPIGITYGEIASSSKPTGPVLDALSIPLVLGVAALRAGRYTLTEPVQWFAPDKVETLPWTQGTITVIFDVSGPK